MKHLPSALKGFALKLPAASLLGSLGVAGVWGACAAADHPFVISPETASAIRACMAVDDDHRLACYDQAVNRTNSTGTQTTPEQRFGLSPAQVVHNENLDSPKKVTSTVVAMGRAPRGPLEVTLANGQVWAQQNADGQELSMSVGDPVTISHEIMGGFLLTSPASGHRSMRVRRIQ